MLNGILYRAPQAVILRRAQMDHMAPWRFFATSRSHVSAPIWRNLGQLDVNHWP